MTQRPAVLIMQRHLAPLSAFLESAYDVYRFWEGPPVEAAGDIRALIVAGEFELDKALIERLPNLSLIACFTAGYDGIDVEWCRARGLPVTHAPGVNHADVADHAIGLILAARRQMLLQARQRRAQGFKGRRRCGVGHCTNVVQNAGFGVRARSARKGLRPLPQVERARPRPHAWPVTASC